MCTWLDRCFSILVSNTHEGIKSRAIASKYDQAIFTWYFGNKLQGMIAAFVDDFCFAKSEIF